MLLFLGGAAVVSVLINRHALYEFVYRSQTERHLNSISSGVLHWGSPHAKVHVQAYLPFDCLCQGDRMRVLSQAARKYGDRLYIEIIDISSALGAKRFAESGLTCSGIFINGRQRVRIRKGGKDRKVYLSGSPPEEAPSGRGYYTTEDLQAAMDQEMRRVYGRAVGSSRPAQTTDALLPPSQARAPALTPESFDAIAQSLFAPVYPGLARQIVEDYHIVSGRCLDVGCGPAYLSVEIAKRTKLHVDALDIDAKAIALAKRNVQAADLTGRFSFHVGDVQDLKFPDDRFALIVSRCSLLCWKDKVKAFSEMYRVLRPGGLGFIGMGSGKYISDRERKRILSVLNELRERGGADEAWLKDLPSTDYLRYIAMKAGVADFRVLRYADGVWVEMHKRLTQAEIRKLRRHHATRHMPGAPESP